MRKVLFTPFLIPSIIGAISPAVVAAAAAIAIAIAAGITFLQTNIVCCRLSTNLSVTSKKGCIEPS